MSTNAEWSKETYENSISSKCWNYTRYDSRWNDSIANDNELKEIVLMEMSLGPIPVWADKIVKKVINNPPPCGHYRFPEQYIQAVCSIGLEQAPEYVHCCFTVDHERKRQMMDYCLCLDAWLAGASPEQTANELTTLGYKKNDWFTVCKELWNILGDHTELKDLLVERTLYQTRWWIKNAVWSDDMASEFGRDQYLGPMKSNGNYANGPGGFTAPVFELNNSPMLQRLENRLSALCKDWEWFRNMIVEFSWPCAPKAFRYLEKLLWCIGKERPCISLPSFPLSNPDPVPGFLQVDDTWPNHDEAHKWFIAFRESLDNWWKGHSQPSDMFTNVDRLLGNRTPVKLWLVRLYAYKLAIHEHDGEIAKMFMVKRTERKGTGKLFLHLLDTEIVPM